jgi:23S rRNA (pseudouridine1915-N3)-methyltransferase
MIEQSKGWWSICMDPSGEALSTEGWRKEWEKLERAGRTKLVWLIGGADGHSKEMQASCDSIRSMGPQTLSHDLAWVVLLEQIYRLESLRAGHPYHRA